MLTLTAWVIGTFLLGLGVEAWLIGQLLRLVRLGLRRANMVIPQEPRRPEPVGADVDPWEVASRESG